ncbi:hypothetical protein P1J78_16240 [Psychromarinibacter sp. C21-152]|uniref:Uncharacterized protein n=1 Tax=Psychromarinibacter sediminicola TaxID=3033385 RepID=A0AAE3NUG3_9RHOB|nr:hypothetical protein [Psychromarinibacter sediminicola]MDF0602291.1 hypothetical protein [Psychromarinibacter sediminicola]
MTSFLPNRLRRAPARPRTRDRLWPVAAGMGLLIAGAWLMRWKPSALDMPDPAPLEEAEAPGAFGRAAQHTRDGAAHLAPDNLGVSLGRSMLIAGTALTLARLLDEAAGSGRG